MRAWVVSQVLPWTGRTLCRETEIVQRDRETARLPGLDFGLIITTHQEVEQPCLGAELVGFALEAFEARVGTVTGVQGLPCQDVLPCALVDGVVDGDNLGHVCFTRVPALWPIPPDKASPMQVYTASVSLGETGYALADPPYNNPTQ